MKVKFAMWLCWFGDVVIANSVARVHALARLATSHTFNLLCLLPHKLSPKALIKGMYLLVFLCLLLEAVLFIREVMFFLKIYIFFRSRYLCKQKFSRSYY